MSNRFAFLSAVHLFLIIDGQILLQRRFNADYENGNYGVVSGHIDGNEPLTWAMCREAKEEAGIIIQPEDLQVIHVMHRKSDQERIDFFLTVKKWEGEPRICEPDKCDDLSWFDLNNLPPNTIAYVKFAIEQYQQRKLFSEFGWKDYSSL